MGSAGAKHDQQQQHDASSNGASRKLRRRGADNALGSGMPFSLQTSQGYITTTATASMNMAALGLGSSASAAAGALQNTVNGATQSTSSVVGAYVGGYAVTGNRAKKLHIPTLTLLLKEHEVMDDLQVLARVCRCAAYVLIYTYLHVFFVLFHVGGQQARWRRSEAAVQAALSLTLSHALLLLQLMNATLLVL